MWYFLLLSVLVSLTYFADGFHGSAMFKTHRSIHAPDNLVSTSSLRMLKESRISMTLTKPIPKIIIAGAPASGKGTQCDIIKSTFGVIHLSSGEILRAAVKEGTELGLKVKHYMESGQLVPDDLIIGVICNRLKQKDCLEKGWLLDGFPRTRAQAEALASEGLIPDSFILLDVPEDVLVERVTGRRTDPVTGKIYHMKFLPPENEEIASRLLQRSDDTEEKVVVRYREFQSHINAIKVFYESMTSVIDGSLDRNEVSSRVISALMKTLSENVMNAK